MPGHLDRRQKPRTVAGGKESQLLARLFSNLSLLLGLLPTALPPPLAAWDDCTVEFGDCRP